MRIIDIELYKLNDNLKTNDTEYKTVEIRFDNKIKKLIYKNGIDEEYGARPLKRAIEKHVSTPLAQTLLGIEDIAESTVNITAVKGKAKFKLEKRLEDPPFYISDEYNEVKEDNIGGLEK